MYVIWIYPRIESDNQILQSILLRTDTHTFTYVSFFDNNNETIHDEMELIQNNGKKSGKNHCKPDPICSENNYSTTIITRDVHI